MSYQSVAALRQYRESSVGTLAAGASPHRLIAMLYEGALERLAIAESGMTFGNNMNKLRGIDSTMAILEHLLSVLDYNAGGDIARKLASLYEYMMRRLLHAKLHNDVDAVKDVGRLLRTIKSGWDAITPPGG